MPQIVYRFSASGHADVARAFKSIGDQAAKSATAEQKAAAAAEKSAAKAAAAKQRAASASIKAEERAANATRREAEKSTKAVEREAKKAADARLREEKRVARETASLRRRDDRAREAGARARNRALGTLGGGMRDAATMAIGAGAGAVGLAARREFAVRAKARDIAISTRENGRAAVDPGLLAAEAHRTAQANKGVNAEQVLSGMQAFTQKTGNLAMARALSGTIATTSSATGASTEDIGAAAADLMQKFDIKTIDGMRDALGKLTVQGKNGAFELKDAAMELPSIAAAAQRFGIGKGSQAVGTLGGLMQIAREATGSGAEAGTAVEQMFSQLIAKSGKLKEAEWGGKGVNVFNKDGSSRDIQDVLVDVIHNVGGNDMEKKRMGMQGVFDVRGIRAISPLLDTYAEAVKNGTDPVKAMRDKMSASINVVGGWNGIVTDAGIAQQAESAKIEAAWDSLASKVGDSVLPELAKFVDAVTNNEEALAALAGTAGILMESFNALAKAFGIVPKPKNAEQDVEDKQKALEEFDNKVNARMDADPTAFDLTDAEVAEQDKLQRELADAVSRRDTLSAAAAGQLSQEDYQAEYDRLGKKGKGPTEMERFANGAVGSLTGGLPGAVSGFMNQGESAEQKALRERMGAPAPAGGAAAPDAAATGVASNEFLKAVGQAAAAMKDAAAELRKKGPLG